jgi:proteasome accessory factor A
MSLFGLETEYAVSSLGPAGQGLERETLVNRLLALAPQRLASLPEFNGGMFLCNGSRFYVDTGLHPELATPEVHNPTDLVRYVLAGERFLAGLVAEIGRGRGKPRVGCFRCNVDYSGQTAATWGCHESFLHLCHPSVLPDNIIPHLVTRIIYTGAGGFDSTSRGIRFLLSPRVPHLVKVVSSSSTGERGIFHDKDEPLAGPGFHRLHILAGESLCSQRAMWLKAATTALVVALIEAGFQPGAAVRLKSPLDAMRAIAADPECKAPIALASGEQSGAVAVQRHYLDLAEKYILNRCAPPWGVAACCEWRRTLDLLESGPHSLATTLDWALKLPLYRRRALKHGLSWESVCRWNPIVERLETALERLPHASRRPTPEVLLGPSSPIRSEVELLTPWLASQGLDWDGLARFQALRDELCEADMRFGQLHGRSIFSLLDASGLLSHHAPGVDRIEEAMGSPPPYGRALRRGEAIARLAGQDGRYVCNWQGIWDQQESRYLDLSNPFETEERWREAKEDSDVMAALSDLGPPFFTAFMRRRQARRAPARADG